MTSNRFGQSFAPLRYDPTRSFVPLTDISRTEVIALGDRLEAARRELLREAESCEHHDGETHFVVWPERTLAEYQRSRRESELGEILGVAKRLRDTVDRVVILSAEAGMLGARALFEAGCHPYHNELSRGDRGGRPRIYFAGDRFDNDAIQGLLDLLCPARRGATVDGRWAILLVDHPITLKAGVQRPRALLAVMETLLAALRDSCKGESDSARRRFVSVCADGGVMFDFLKALDCGEVVGFPAAQSGCRSILSAAGLLPAAVMGMDIVALLRGGAAMSDRFRTAPPGDNPALDYAALSHVVGPRSNTAGRQIISGTRELEATARWCGYLHWESEVRQRRRPPPGGVHNSLMVDSVRRDRLMVPPMSYLEEDDPSKIGGALFAEHQAAADRALGTLLSAQKHPAADLHLPTLEESSLGQLFQMMLLATAIEERLGLDGSTGQPASDA